MNYQDVRELLSSTSKIMSFERAIWLVQRKHEIVKGPKLDCIYGCNNYGTAELNLQNPYGRIISMFESSDINSTWNESHVFD